MAIIPMNTKAKIAPNLELMSERIELIMNCNFLISWPGPNVA
jgi:hypothetical protein